jgi:hypothetical protein
MSLAELIELVGISLASWAACGKPFAVKLFAEELDRLGWTKEEPARRRKNDAAKLAMAVRLRNRRVA